MNPNIMTKYRFPSQSIRTFFVVVLLLTAVVVPVANAQPSPTEEQQLASIASQIQSLWELLADRKSVV